MASTEPWATKGGAFTEEARLGLIRLRNDLHQYPELSLQEHRTAARLRDELKQLGASDVRMVAGTGVVARIPGQNSTAPVVAIRGDIDALPIEEQTGLAFASVNAGVMHACGHDVHATWTVGAARLLMETPAEGDVLIILQPAEEIGEGARAILASGELDEVAAIFGGHVDRRFAVGEVVVQEGPVAASADTFDVTLRGAGSHGARPHEGSDPVVGMGALIGALQTIVSRRVNPANPAVVTIGRVHGGTARNIIPAEATLGGTLRATDPVTRQLLKDEVKRIGDEIAVAYRLTGEVEIHEGSPPIVNPPEPTGWAREAAGNVLGAGNVLPLPTLNMGGEDFAFYLERIPGCFLRIGAREPEGEVIPAHSPYFYAAEACIFAGAAVLAECARVASASLAGRERGEPSV